MRVITVVSFDVISLFTKIPVDLAVKVAEERLREDASLGQRTSLPVEDIIHLLSFCLKTTQFTYNGTYYQQVFGTAMGSPVSAVIANMVMEDVEQRALATSLVKPFFWKNVGTSQITIRKEKKLATKEGTNTYNAASI